MSLQQGSCVAVSLLESPSGGESDGEALLFSCLVESGRLRSFLVKSRDVVKTLFPRLDVIYWQNPYKLTVTQLLGTLLSSEAGPVNVCAAVLPVELLVKLCEASLSYEFLKSFFSICSEVDSAFSVVETSNAEQKVQGDVAMEKAQTLDPATEASADLILSKMREKLVEMRAAPAASSLSSSSLSFQTPVKPSVSLQLLEPNPVLDQWLRGLWGLQLDPQSPGLSSVSERLAAVNEVASFSSPETDHSTNGSSIMSSPGSVTDDAGLLIDSRLALHAALRARTTSGSNNNNSSQQRTFTLSLDESGATKNTHDISLLWPCVALAEGLGCTPLSAFLLRKVEQIMIKALQRGAVPEGVFGCIGLDDTRLPGQTQAQKDALVKALRTHFATHGVPDVPSLVRDEPVQAQSFSMSGASPVTDCDVDSPHVLATPFGRFSPHAGDSPLTEGARANALAGASRGAPESPSTSFLSHDSLDGATPLQSPPLPHSRPQYPLLHVSRHDGASQPDTASLARAQAQAQAEAEADREQRDAVFDRSESESEADEDEKEDEDGEEEKEGQNDGSSAAAPVLRPTRCDVEPTQRRTSPFASSSSSHTQRPTSRSLSRSQPDAASQSQSQSQSQSSFRDDSLSRSLAVMRCQPFLREKRAQQAAKETEAALRASRLKSVELAQRSARLGWGKAGTPRRLPAAHRSPSSLNRSTSFDLGQHQSRLSSVSASRLDVDADLLEEEEAGLSPEAKAAQRRAAQRVRERSRQLLTQTQREQQDKQRRDAAVWGERDRRIKLFMERQKGGRLYLMSMGSGADSGSGSGVGGYSSRYQGANSSSSCSNSDGNIINNNAARQHQQEYSSDDDDDDREDAQGWGWNGEQEQQDGDGMPLVALHSRKPWTVGSPVSAPVPAAAAALAERVDDDNGVFVLRAPSAGAGAGDGWSSVSLDGECEDLSEPLPPPPPPISSVSITVLRARDLMEGLGGCNPYVLLDWAYLGRRSTEPFVSPSAGLRSETNPVFGSKLLFKPPFLWSGEGAGGEGSLFALDKELEGREVFITTPSKQGQGQGTVTTAATLCAPVLRVFVYSRNVSVSDELLGEGEVDVDTMMCACQNGLPFSVELFDTVGHRQYAGTVDLCFEL